MTLIEDYPNLVVFRTFSKMFALECLRLGYLAGDRMVLDIIRRTCVVYSVNGLAQAAALAIIEDSEEHVLRTRELIRTGKAFLEKEIGRLRLPYITGEGNYMMIKLPMNDGLAYRKLMSHGVMVRSMTDFRFPDWIRVSIAHEEAMEAFITALEKILPQKEI
jgi:histidinol-phosphate aminotransferase